MQYTLLLYFLKNCIWKSYHSKVWGCYNVSMFFKEVSYAHPGCTYLIKNTVKTVILWHFITISNNCFLFYFILKCNVILWCKAQFSAAITPVFSVTWYFRNHSNMLIGARQSFLIIVINVKNSLMAIPQFLWNPGCFFVV